MEFILVQRNGHLARGVWGHAPQRIFFKKGAILCYLGAFPRLYFRLSEGHNITIFFFQFKRYVMSCAKSNILYILVMLMFDESEIKGNKIRIVFKNINQETKTR